ncbi:DUF5722 domain-containing protein [Planctomicrobium sp. SH527]|uniref:DUF5722 domain-containing protein n=1 Tax=Planctomicrobium sp. SH527 TaxID=3448123 RepID=UPI003F5C9652
MDAHAVTFRNLKVLMSHLNTPEPQFEGKPRGAILPERGFHFVNRRGSDELEQAAAYAVAYKESSKLISRCLCESGSMKPKSLHFHGDPSWHSL